MPPSTKTQHGTVDQVLLAVATGADEMEYLRMRCDLSNGSILRAIDILERELLVVRQGPRHALKFKPTPEGLRAMRRLRSGEPRVDLDCPPTHRRTK